MLVSSSRYTTPPDPAMVFLALRVSKSEAHSASSAVITAARVGGERRLEPRVALAALQRLEQGRLLPADVRAGADHHAHVEVEARSEDVLPQIPLCVGLVDRLLQPCRRHLAELPAAVDVGEVAVERVAADHQSLDQHVRALLQDRAILEGARLALVGVHHQVVWEAGLLADEVPLHAGGEPGAAAAAP